MDEAQRRDYDDYDHSTPTDPPGRDGSDQATEPISNITNFADRTKQQLEPTIDKAREQVEHGLDKAMEEVEQGKGEVAESLQSTAERLRAMSHENDGMTAQAEMKLAGGMESTATYLKNHTGNEMLKDFEAFVKKHPVRSLAGAIIAGILVGRMVR